MDDSGQSPRLVNEMAHVWARLHCGRARAAVALALLLASCRGPSEEVDAGTGAGPDAGVEAGPDAGSDGGLVSLQPKATAEGTPIGDAVVVSVGPGGGAVASQDGVISLNVLANAVNAATDISVQTITNTAWGGLGNAYRTLAVGPGLRAARPDYVQVHRRRPGWAVRRGAGDRRPRAEARW